MRLSDVKYLDTRLQKLVEIILKDCKYHNLPFEVFETGRTIERQIELKKKGFSKTLKSKHLIKVNNAGIITEKSHAVDFVLRYKYNGKLTWSWANIGDKRQQLRDLSYYKMLSYMVTTRYEDTLNDLMINSIISGGHWNTLKDWPHYSIT